MITLQCKLTFENEKDKQKLLELMRHFSSCYRYAYNRLVEGHKRKELNKQQIKILQSLNSKPQTRELGSLWKEQVRGYKWSSYKLWQVVKVDLTIPVTWDRGEGNRRNTASWGVPVAVKAEYKYPSPKCKS